MKTLEFLKKFKLLNPLELSLSLLGGLFFILCLLCSLVYFDNGGGGRGLASRAQLFGAVVAKNGGLFAGFDDENCDYFDGEWVWDETYPLYDSRDCSFLDDGFRCSENGRPDHNYTKWRWQPRNCNLPRFNAKVMLENLRNKRLVFVGDSIGRNQWESLMCMLSSAVTNKASIYEVNGNPITKHMGSLVFKFEEYNCTIEYYRSPFLVVQGRAPHGSPPNVRTTLRVDQLDWSSSKWRDSDVLIFNSGHWWNYEKTIRSGSYFQEGDQVNVNMTVQAAFRRSIKTLVDWVDNQVNTSKTSVFFRSYAPVHFSGGDWKTGGKCHLETMPDLKTPYMPKYWHHFNAVNDVLSDHANKSEGSKLNLLNVTYLTMQRKDGHASVYFVGPIPAPLHRQDCSHWCLPGVPDTWNELLFAVLLKKQQSLDSRNATISWPLKLRHD